MKKIYFVVLNYQTTEETTGCINSIKKLANDTTENHVIIVDNASPNGSGQKLAGLFADDEMTEVVLSADNLGFARGNNIGYRIAKSHNADFIVIINSDTLITDRLFTEKIVNIYEKTGFAVLGPDILAINSGIHQNPMPGMSISTEAIQRKINKTAVRKLLNTMGLSEILRRRRNSKSKADNTYKENCVIDDCSRYVLQGSCMIFSEIYINISDGLSEDTFMYYEEYFLYHFCKKNGLKMLYSPELQIEHYCGTSVKSVFPKNQAKSSEKFFCMESEKSLKALLKMIRNDENTKKNAQKIQ